MSELLHIYISFLVSQGVLTGQKLQAREIKDGIMECKWTLSNNHSSPDDLFYINSTGSMRNVYVFERLSRPRS